MFFGPKSATKHSLGHSLGHSEAGAQKHSKSTLWGTFQPEPLGTPVNGARDRKTSPKLVAKSPVGMTDLKIRQNFLGVGDFYRCRLQMLVWYKKDRFEW